MLKVLLGQKCVLVAQLPSVPFLLLVRVVVQGLLKGRLFPNEVALLARQLRLQWSVDLLLHPGLLLRTFVQLLMDPLLPVLPLERPLALLPALETLLVVFVAPFLVLLVRLLQQWELD